VPLILCCGIGALLWIVLPIAKLVLMIVAGVRASNGERWRYPFIYRVIV
jgi:uncharacterized Tic20 family protein